MNIWRVLAVGVFLSFVWGQLCRWLLEMPAGLILAMAGGAFIGWATGRLFAYFEQR
jgi:hypothetical protein